MGKKSKNADLGRAIVRKQEKKAAAKTRWNTPAAQMAAAVGRHTSSDTHGSNLVSVLDATDLEELMLNATLANQTFAAERHASPLAPQSVVVVTPLDGANRNSALAAHRREERKKLDRRALRIPRRPVWSSETTYEELMKAENDSFLLWRRHIAELEEQYALSVNGTSSMTLTPFEKNLQVWRQLWRVVERSDLILQIIDARNPLLYFCEDLVRYVVDEMQRAHLIVMNKADLLSAEMIDRWRQHFHSRGVDVVFFSAFKASVGETLHNENVLGANELIQRIELANHTNPHPREDGRVVVGLCGYPNVGKSSTINVLLETVANSLHADHSAAESDNGLNDDKNSDASNGNETEHTDFRTKGGDENGVGPKRVAVSATPGKTKHFQTLMLTNRAMLCDCPGLVFPNFSSSKAELICAGVLSIDTLRGDYISPVSLICDRIPSVIFEGVYGLRFEQSSLVKKSAPTRDGQAADIHANGGKETEDTEDNSSSKNHTDRVDEQGGRIVKHDYYVSAQTLLDRHARARGFMTDHGRSDGSRSARVILKDFVNGRIVYSHGPDENGESGVGASVFAKKGRLVYARQEEQEKQMENNSDTVNRGHGNTGNFTTGSAILHGSTLSEDPGIKNSESGTVHARVSGSKRDRGKEFVRVQRSFYPNA